MRQDLFDVKVAANWSLAIPTVGIFFSGHAFFAIRFCGDVSRVDPNVRRHVQRSTVSVVLVKAIDVWTIFYGLSEIDFVIFFCPVPTKMPFANHCCVIASAFHQVTKRRAVRWNQMFAATIQNPFR